MKKLITILFLIPSFIAQASKPEGSADKRQMRYFTFDSTSLLNIAPLRSNSEMVTEQKPQTPSNVATDSKIEVTKKDSSQTDNFPSMKTNAELTSASITANTAPLSVAHTSQPAKTIVALSQTMKRSPGRPYTAPVKQVTKKTVYLGPVTSAREKYSAAQAKKKDEKRYSCSAYNATTGAIKPWSSKIALKATKSIILEPFSMSCLDGSITKLDNHLANKNSFKCKPDIILPYLQTMISLVEHSGFIVTPIKPSNTSKQIAEYALDLAIIFNNTKHDVGCQKNKGLISGLLDAISAYA